MTGKNIVVCVQALAVIERFPGRVLPRAPPVHFATPHGTADGKTQWC